MSTNSGPSGVTTRSASRHEVNHPEVVEDVNETCVIVGVDFGATFSSMAYAIVNHKAFREGTWDRSMPPPIYDVKRFPREKSPGVVATELLYDTAGSNGIQVKDWGNTAYYDRAARRNDEVLVKLPKLLLADAKGGPRHEQIDRLEAVANSIGKTGTEMTTDYLLKLMGKLQQYLEQHHHHHANSPRYHYCGVPASWKLLETEKLSQACLNAGMCNLSMVSEPEAAATSILTPDVLREQYIRVQRLITLVCTGSTDIIKRGEKVLVIDAGGMTVVRSMWSLNSYHANLVVQDAIVYKIVSEDPLELEAATTGKSEQLSPALKSLEYTIYFEADRCRQILWLRLYQSSVSQVCRGPAKGNPMACDRSKRHPRQS